MKKTTTTTTLFVSALVAAVAGVSVFCTDPVPDRLVKAQGAELNGYPVGEFHRPGENCTACHKDNGEADTTFSVAGTIFSGPNSLTGVGEADVELTDSVGTQFIARTNCVGNFFVKPSDWSPKFPILVRVHKSQTALVMKGPIGREASCGACHLGHKLLPAELHAFEPHIALFGGDEPFTGTVSDAGCGADANVPGYGP